MNKEPVASAAGFLFDSAGRVGMMSGVESVRRLASAAKEAVPATFNHPLPDSIREPSLSETAGFIFALVYDRIGARDTPVVAKARQ